MRSMEGAGEFGVVCAGFQWLLGFGGVQHWVESHGVSIERAAGNHVDLQQTRGLDHFGWPRRQAVERFSL